MLFERKINYYETDMMGIVHHSNYVRFLEEARVQHLNEIGLPYKKIEDSGVLIPVLSTKCEYKYPARFDDIIVINLEMTEFNGVKMKLKYTITNKENGNIVAVCETAHCFTDKNLKPLSLKKHFPEMYNLFFK